MERIKTGKEMHAPQLNHANTPLYNLADPRARATTAAPANGVHDINNGMEPLFIYTSRTLSPVLYIICTHHCNIPSLATAIIATPSIAGMAGKHTPRARPWKYHRPRYIFHGKHTTVLAEKNEYS